MKLKLLPKVTVLLTVLGTILTVVISIFSYAHSKTYLEEMYAQRVLTGANSIASMLNIDDVRTILSPDGDKTEAYKKTKALFNSLKKDGKISFLSLVVPDEDSVTFYIDTCVPELGDDPKKLIPYGQDILYVDAAQDEHDLEKYDVTWEYYAQNKGVPTPLITDNSYGYNYTAVSPVLDENGEAIAEVQYILDMAEVRKYLHSVLSTMLIISFFIIATGFLILMLVTKKIIIQPIGKLAAFTQEITKSGEFKNHRVSLDTGDEIESLGNSFNYMMEKLEQYIENLSVVTAEKERISAELNVATQIQASMLPCIFPPFPEHPEVDIYASMEPAKEVGGDFYDFFLVDEDHMAMVIADVSGKGVPAALFMVIAKTLLKNSVQTGETPKQVLEKVNNQLCENNEAEMFVTVWLGVLELSTGKMICANAGHEYPVLRRAQGNYELVKDKHGFVLAGLENSNYREYELILNRGDSLFVYTDGVPEATNTEKELYGTNRMLEVLNRNQNAHPSVLLSAVKADIDEFVGSAPQFDDITMMGLVYYGPQGKASAEKMKELTVAATLENLDVVQRFVEDQLEMHDCPMKTMIQISTSLEEIYVNIAHYAYHPEVGDATIQCCIDENPRQVTIRLLDRGKPFDPLKKPDADITLSAEERQIGGLGIFMVKKTMDEVLYAYRDGYNVLTLKKMF